MVRFQWHVEDGLGASVGPGQLVYLRDHGVLQAMVEIEMPGGSGSLEACMNIPQNYNTDSGVKELGIIIAHGAEPSDWRGRLLADLAVSLARTGYLVVRYICHPSASAARRVAVFDKVADVAATSPYARGVTRWVLAGLGSGARVAALAGARVRSALGGFVLMSYPLKEEMPEMPGAESPASPMVAADSSGPLLGLSAPVLFVSASTDPGVSEAALGELGPRMTTSDVRSVVLQDVDSHFRNLTGKGPHAATIRAVSGVLHEFLNAVHSYRMDYCKLPRIWRVAGGGGAAGLTAAPGADNGGGKSAAAAQQADRPQLQRPACFRPIPSGPPPQNSQQLLAQHQQHHQQQALAMQGGSFSYGLTATAAAQALAAQIHQRQQAATGGGPGGGAAAAQLLAQQVLLQQAAAAAASAAAAQRRTSEQQAEVGPASAAGKLAAAAAAATRGGSGAGLAQVLSDPNAAAQLAAMLIRNSTAQQQQHVLQLGVQQAAAAAAAAAAGDSVAGGTGQQQPQHGSRAGPAGSQALILQALSPTAIANAAATAGSAGGGQGLTVEALTSVLVQRLAQHHHQQLQLQLQGAGGGGASALQQQQLQHLLLQHHQRQQQQQSQQQRQALLLQGAQAGGPLQPGALAAAAGRGGGVLMLHPTVSGGVMTGAAGVQTGGLGEDEGEDAHMADAGS